MAKVYTGRDGSLLLAGTTQAKVTAWSFQADVEVLETTTLGEAQRSYTPGIQSFSGSATLLYYKADDGSIDASNFLTKVITAGTTGITTADVVTMTLRLADGTDNNDITFAAYITSASIGANVGEITTAQISFQTTGALTAAALS
jgi:hypothetical protein